MPKAKDVTPGDAGRAAGGGVEPTRPPQDGLPQPLKKKGPTATSGWRGDKHSSRGGRWTKRTQDENGLWQRQLKAGSYQCSHAQRSQLPRRKVQAGVSRGGGQSLAWTGGWGIPLLSPVQGGSSELLLEGKGWSAQPLRSENLWNLPIFKKNPGHVVATPGNPT